MMKRVVLIFLAALFCLCNVKAQWLGPPPSISGVVYSARTGALPGVTVSLVHPYVGRSRPSISDVYGIYSFPGVPPQADPYYIEAYWGNTLIYRNLVTYRGGSIRVDIRLP